MAEAMHFELVSPEQLLVSEEVESVTVPGAEGEFTVLARHAPFMSTLKPGVVEVRGLAGENRKIFVRGGFADVTPAGLTILADGATPLEDLDAASFAEEIRAAEEELAALGEAHPKRLAAQTKLDQLRNMQRWIIPA
jgi:F-type H+-transporting ATPase subunit epsilon